MSDPPCHGPLGSRAPKHADFSLTEHSRCKCKQDPVGIRQVPTVPLDSAGAIIFRKLRSKVSISYSIVRLEIALVWNVSEMHSL